MSTLTVAEEQLSTLTLSPTQEREPVVYRYAHLLPVVVQDKYPPLEPFEHVEPGLRALQHTNPRSFLLNASKVNDLTPALGTEVDGISLKNLSSGDKDQLALEVAKRGLLVFRNQQDFLEGGIDWYREWGSYFGRSVSFMQCV